MDKIIIYPVENGIDVVIPAKDCGLSLNEIASKDVPNGVPYKIINHSDLPEGNTFRNAWKADFSEPDGYGIGKDAWFAKQALNGEAS